jgi:hypothetical protein
MPLNRLRVALALGLGLTLLVGCEQKGPAQKAGEKVDKAVGEAGKKVRDAAK